MIADEPIVTRLGGNHRIECRIHVVVFRGPILQVAGQQIADVNREAVDCWRGTVCRRLGIEKIVERLVSCSSLAIVSNVDSSLATRAVRVEQLRAQDIDLRQRYVVNIDRIGCRAPYSKVVLFVLGGAECDLFAIRCHAAACDQRP